MSSALMLCEQLALVTATIFAGPAVYVSFADQPARLLFDDWALLTQRKPSNRRGTLMKSLALACTLFELRPSGWDAIGAGCWVRC
jgi:hypothetical protein